MHLRSAVPASGYLLRLHTAAPWRGSGTAPHHSLSERLGPRWDFSVLVLGMTGYEVNVVARLARVPSCSCAFGALVPVTRPAALHCTTAPLLSVAASPPSLLFAGNRKGTWETEPGPIATDTPPCPAPDHPPMAMARQPLTALRHLPPREGRPCSRPSSNKRHPETRQPLTEAAGRPPRSFRYTCLVSSSRLSLQLYPCFRSPTPVLSISLHRTLNADRGPAETALHSPHLVVSARVSSVAWRYYKSTASPLLSGRP